MNSLIKKIIETGSLPSDSEDEKLRKSSLTVMALPFAFAGLVWGMLYFINGMYLPGSIPTSYGILSILSYIHFSVTRKFKFFRNSQLFLILILPFLLQLSLGGFIPSSAVIFWALISPVGALVFLKPRNSLGWFAAYISLVVVAYLVNDQLSQFFEWGISDSFINMVFLLNIIAISTLIFVIQYHFFGNQAKLKKDIELKNTALNEQSEKLKELDKAKSRFFANISHEFRTPLTLILGLVNKQLSNPDQQQSRQDGETIQRNAQRLLQLINQLLDLSKLESGELKLNLQQLDFVAFARRMIMLFESMADSKNITIYYNGQELKEVNHWQPVALKFDFEKMEKVLTNLLSNAIKFTDSNGIIRININKSDESIEQPVAIFSISNTGKPIPAEKLQHVFDRFYQVEADSTRMYEGTGIGLALVKELVELHEGTVGVSSNPDETIFTIRLPIAEDVDLRESQPSGEESFNAIDMIPDGRSIDSSPMQVSDGSQPSENTENESDLLEVLIVEDNPDLRKFIGEILTGDYKVTYAVDGVDGWQKAETLIPDLIVSDVMMPRMDGYELCHKLKQGKKTDHIPVILLTAKASRENKIEGLETGADDYLVKPFDEEELRIRIKNLLSIREKLQQKFQQEVWLKPKEVKVSSIHQKFLESIKEITEKHIDNDQFSVEDLGSEIGMSRSQVHRKLKALTNQSATTLIRNYRLRRAAELLQQQSGNVTEIAYQVGFSSQTYFSTCFQELFGYTPSEYKNKKEEKINS